MFSFDQFLPLCNSDNPNGAKVGAGQKLGESCGVEENTLKLKSDELLEFYRMDGFPLEITTAYELGELERKQAAAVTEEVFDEFDPIRAHGMGVSLEWIM